MTDEIPGYKTIEVKFEGPYWQRIESLMEKIRACFTEEKDSQIILIACREIFSERFCNEYIGRSYYGDLFIDAEGAFVNRCIKRLSDKILKDINNEHGSSDISNTS